MATLTVWKFPQEGDAQRAVDTLEGLQRQELIKIHDAALVEWTEGKKKPKTRQLNDLTGAGALGGAFWGLLFGLLFFIPLLGFALGAAGGALAGSLRDVGIDDEFIEETKKSVTPGTSALFVLTSDAVQDKVHDAFGDLNAELVHTNLSAEDEAKLHEVFGEH
ncbi:DUF1269 domain-containing protein [Janibacter cremeus]|uniref:Putative membrane protein n=1 Tax=Janibacter cremeus TaxID=1285192 RepID=A0A852VNM4_9MICO|nr:DUF1269 domain-containing protein [Janibacter cremeus]NYF97288.1 putative membrane protein [Janibacter cremeus]